MVSEQVRHKPACTATEAGYKLEVEEELYYPSSENKGADQLRSSENKGADQLRSYCEADLRLCFRLGRLLVFPCGGSIIIRNIVHF